MVPTSSFLLAVFSYSNGQVLYITIAKETFSSLAWVKAKVALVEIELLLKVMLRLLLTHLSPPAVLLYGISGSQLPIYNSCSPVSLMLNLIFAPSLPMA